LRWSTTTEVNNDGFTIERRQSRVWEKVGFVPGSGISTSRREYAFSDKGLSAGRYAYRIGQIDNDGTVSYHGEAEVEVGMTAKAFAIEPNFPNPFNPSTTIAFTISEDGMATLTVHNILGQPVMTLYDGPASAGRWYEVKFDASSLPSGSYVARLESGNQQVMRKMVLLK
jgi:hypothetical protein